jgi:hypothetical protein
MITIPQAVVLAAGLLVAPIAIAQQPGSQTGGDTLKSTTAPKTGDASAPSAAGGGAALGQTTKPGGEKQIQGNDKADASTGPASSKQPAPK